MAANSVADLNPFTGESDSEMNEQLSNSKSVFNSNKNPFAGSSDEDEPNFSNARIVIDPGSMFDFTEYPSSFPEDMSLREARGVITSNVRTSRSSAEDQIIETQPIRQQPQVHRRQLPVSTMGWVSTSRTQFMPVTGLDFLIGVQTVVIQQTVMTIHSSSCEKRYIIKVPFGETLYATTEYSNELQRTCLGSQRSFRMLLSDHTQQTVAMFYRKMGCALSWIPCLLQNLEVYLPPQNYGIYAGQVRQDFSYSSISFTILDKNGYDLYRLFGPNSCGWTVPLDATFALIGGGGGGRLGSISRIWNPSCGDYDLKILFPAPGTPEEEKLLIIAGAFLIEYMFFEHRSSCCLRIC